MATVRLIPDTRAKKDGSQMILLVIRIGKTRFVFSTGISTPSSEKFNEVSYLDKSVPQSKVKNVRLVSLKNKAEKLIIDDEARLSPLPSISQSLLNILSKALLNLRIKVLVR